MTNNKPSPEQIADLKARVSKLTPEKRLETATAIIKQSNGKFDQASIMTYLTEQAGLTMGEYLEALNRASDGELLKNV